MGDTCSGEGDADADADINTYGNDIGPDGIQDGAFLEGQEKERFQDSASESSSTSGDSDSTISGDEEGGKKKDTFQFTVSQTTINGFRCAVEEGNDSLVRFYIIEYEDENFLRVIWDEGPHQGDNSLHVAVAKKSMNTVKFLLDEGMNPNDVNPLTGDTPLHYAVRARKKEICELLLEYMADAQAENWRKDEDGNKNHNTPISEAAELDYYEIVHLLKAHAVEIPKPEKGSEESGYSDDDDEESFDSQMDERLRLDMEAQKNKPERSEEKEAELWKPPEHSKTASLSLETKFKKQMSAGDVTQMKAMKVVRTNPFTKIHLVRAETVGVERKARKMAKLPKMAAFLQKRTPRPPYIWNRRWAQVTESYFFWSETMMSTHFKGSKPTIEELKRFKGHVRLDQVVSVEVVAKSKKQNKFMITMNAKSRKYSGERSIIWKCQRTEDRDFWVKGLNDYITWYNKTDDYFG